MTTVSPSATGQATVVPLTNQVTRKHPLAECEKCDLYGNKFVPSAGPNTATIALVGEAPGNMEVQNGEPFVGPSGKLLGVVLDHHNIDIATAFRANACSCRPPSNGTPSKIAIKSCKPRLEAELADLPNLEFIITLGNSATQSLHDPNSKITSTRVGPPRRYVYKEREVKLIPTFHPAACLRNSDSFPSMVNDIGKMKPYAGTQFTEPDYRVYDEPGLAVRAITELRTNSRYSEVVVDIEVGIEKDLGFDHPEHYTMLCIGFGYARGKVLVIAENALKDVLVKKAIAMLLNTKEWIAHNGKFDLAGLFAFTNIKGHLYFDTMLASYCLNEVPGSHGLKGLAVELLNAPRYDDELKRYIKAGDSYALVPRDILYKYNAYDVACTWLLYERFQAELAEQEGLRGAHDFLCEVSQELMFAEMEGIGVDTKYNDELMATYLDSLDELKGPLARWVDNPNSPKQVKEALEEHFKLKVVTTNEEQLTIFKNTAAIPELKEFMELMLKWRREAKLYGTYVKGIKKRLYRGRVHPTFLLHGTVTGRSACRNPNMQNIPRESKIRQQFIPTKGNIYVQGDYRQAELRVVLVESGERGPVFDIICDLERDLFDELSIMLYGLNWTKEQRVRTKAFVHGTDYGRSYISIASEYGMSPSEGKNIQEAWFSMVPTLRDWQKDIRDRVLNKQEDLISFYGRRRRFWLITDDNRNDIANEALSFIPQCTASDICLSALVTLRRDYGIPIILPVHDSLLAEVKESEANEVSKLMMRVMEDAARPYLEHHRSEMIFPVDMKIGSSWGDL